MSVRKNGRHTSELITTMSADEHSIKRYKEFKEFNKRICVATDVFGRGIDIERINLAINYDLPGDADSYLHRVGRAGRFGTKGLSISFVSSEADQDVIKAIETRFENKIPYVPQSRDLEIDNTSADRCTSEFPEKGVDASTYMGN